MGLKNWTSCGSTWGEEIGLLEDDMSPGKILMWNFLKSG
jgi:hypothetical protein